MDRSAALFGAAMFVVFAGLTSLASQKIGQADKDGAVAAAIKDEMEQLLGSEVVEGKDPSTDLLLLCIESKVPLSTEAIAQDLAGTIIRPIPVDRCTSKTVEGDFGMFSALTYYYDAKGNEAGHLKVATVSCPSSRTCIVDLDGGGSGRRYSLRRDGQVWSVLDSTTTWVV